MAMGTVSVTVKTVKPKSETKSISFLSSSTGEDCRNSGRLHKMQVAANEK
jgi:hypothetical protein